jgi:hypothetical protein
MDSSSNTGEANGPLLWGGLLAFLAGFVIFMGIITGEIYSLLFIRSKSFYTLLG